MLCGKRVRASGTAIRLLPRGGRRRLQFGQAQRGDRGHPQSHTRFAGARQWVAPSATGVGGSLNSGFLYYSLPHARPVPAKSWSCTSWFGSGLRTRPASATAGVVARKELKVYFFLPHARPVPVKVGLELNRSAVGKTANSLVYPRPQHLTPSAPARPLP